jgi:hypothetical protein
MSELKPCPFCGSKEVMFWSPTLRYRCEQCDAFGPSSNPHDPIGVWNRRTPAPEQREAQRDLHTLREPIAPDWEAGFQWWADKRAVALLRTVIRLAEKAEL